MSRTPPAPVTPSVLRWARDDAGLSEAELGALAKVNGERVRRWESGEDRPTLAQLRLVADGLGRPVAFFFAPAPPARHTEHPPDFRASRHRLSRALRRELQAVTDRRRSYGALTSDDAGLAWQSWRDDPPATPDDARRRLGVSPADVATTASPAVALRLWIDAIEAQGVLVFQMSGIDVGECRGFAQYDDAIPVIVLNGADAPQARSFTLLHEFAHLLDHSGALCLLDENRNVEQRCNRFAAAVLMPSELLREAVSRFDAHARVDAVVRQFRVSPVAAALRLRALSLVSQAIVNATLRQAEIAARQAAEKNRTGGPEHHLLKRRNLGERYIGAVLDALARDAITFADATYFLESGAATVERIEGGLVGSRN